MSVLDQISDMPDMEKIAAARVDWKVATQEGNKLCNKIHKMMKNIKETDTFKTEIILALNEFLDTVFDIINNKVPGLGEFLELKGLEQIHRPDWGRAFLTIDELRHEIYNQNRIKLYTILKPILYIRIRQPIRPPDTINEQLTEMETKMQLILARIPKTEDFVKELKNEYKNGTMNTSDEFLRVQNGLRHITHRMDEIEDFRDLWKMHKDPLSTMVKKKNVPFNARPNDIAGIRLYQFINTPLGTPCYQLLTLNGWPTTEEWKSWEAWWNIQMQRITDHEDQIGIKGTTAAWPMQVAHTTAMIMKAIYDIHTAAAENMAQIQLEPLIWKLAFIQNALTEIFIVPRSTDKGWFANLWKANEKILAKKITIKDMQNILTSLMPAKIPEEHILHVSTPAKDLLQIKDHELVVATTNIPVPRIRSIPTNYRLQLDTLENKENIPPETKGKLSKKGKTSKKEKSSRVILQTQTNQKINKQKQPTRKRKKVSSSESSAEEEENSSEDDLEKHKVIIGSSSSEDEDFNVYM